MNDEARTERAITRGKPFEKGNPGKPKGARHRVTRAIEALLEGQHEALTKAAIDKALEGDTVALRLCLDRLAPPRRDAPVSIELPPVRSAADAVEASAAVLAAISAGDITPDEAGRVHHDSNAGRRSAMRPGIEDARLKRHRRGRLGWRTRLSPRSRHPGRPPRLAPQQRPLPHYWPMGARPGPTDVGGHARTLLNLAKSGAK